MAVEKNQKLINLVNASGFVFQLGVEHEITKSKDSRQQNWGVLVREHPWPDPETGKVGFIDLILEDGNIRIVVECKKAQDATWVFLIPNENILQTNLVRCQWVDRGNQRFLSGWYDFRCTPASFEAQFCVVRGSGERERTVLVINAASLLDVLSELKPEEKNFWESWPWEVAR